MHKRDFLAAALGAAALPALARSPKSPLPPRTPQLLTVAGAIGAGNRGALDPAFDQLLKKHNIDFSKAHTFDFATLIALPVVSIKPTLEYDARIHTLEGPLLADVIAATGARIDDAGKLVMRALDGYAVETTMAAMRRDRMIVATHLDGVPLPLGGLGPLWATLDADRLPERMARPLAERYFDCPWGVYFIDVQSG